MSKQQITWYFSIGISVYSNVALRYSHKKKSDNVLQGLVTHQFLKRSDYPPATLKSSHSINHNSPMKIIKLLSNYLIKISYWVKVKQWGNDNSRDIFGNYWL